MLEIYTDGSAIHNPWPWGRWVIICRSPEIILSWSLPHTTNNVMELTAVIHAMEHCILHAWASLPQTSLWWWFFTTWDTVEVTPHCVWEDIIIYTDSTYVQKWVTEWMSTWIKRNRRKAKGGQLVSNVELWKRLHSLLPAFTNLQRQRVKAHAWNTLNERVDDIARNEAEKMMRTIV